jgi:hypothetical protein
MVSSTQSPANRTSVFQLQNFIHRHGFFSLPLLSTLVWLVALIALAAAAIACGLCRPVTLESWRPRGIGKKLVRRFDASELAGRDGLVRGLLREVGSLAAGWNDARRFADNWRAGMDDFVARWRGRVEGDCETVWCEYGPGLEMGPVEFGVRDGVLMLSASGDDVFSRLSDDLRGILDSEALDRLERVRVGVVGLRACGLGVVRLSGLKLWPIIVSFVFTLEFHLGLPSVFVFIVGRGRWFPVGVTELVLGDSEGRLLGGMIIDLLDVRPFRGALPELTGGIVELRDRPG